MIPGIVLMQTLILALAAAVLAVPVLVRRAEKIRDNALPGTRWHRWLIRANEAFQHRMLTGRE